MGLFDKKYCDICGEKISLLGNRKLDDGNMCSGCSKLISPFFTGRRKTTVADMKEHLAYREENRQKVSSFQVSETYGEGRKLFIDRSLGGFILSYDSPGSWEKENPDVIPLGEVSSCYLDIKEKREELYIKDSDGNRKSYSPPRYKYLYDFNLQINLSSKWFTEIEWKLNSFDVEGLNSQKYHNYQVMGQQIIDALTTFRSRQGTANAGGTTAQPYQDPEGAKLQAELAGMPKTEDEAAAVIAQAKAQALQALQTTGVSRDAKKVCPNCSQFCTGKFCEECGAVAVYPISIQCASCGCEMDMDSIIPKFCPACGHKIDTGDMVQHPVPGA